MTAGGATGGQGYQVPENRGRPQSCWMMLAALAATGYMWCLNALVVVMKGQVFFFDNSPTLDQRQRLEAWLATPLPVILTGACMVVDACLIAAGFKGWRWRKLLAYDALNLAALVTGTYLVWLRISG